MYTYNELGAAWLIITGLGIAERFSVDAQEWIV